MDAVTNYYTLGGLKQYTFIFLKFWRPDVQNQVQYTEISVNGVFLSLEAPGRSCSLLLATSGGYAHSLAWGYMTSGLYSHFRALICGQISLFSLRRTLTTAFRAHLDNPGLYPPHPPLFFFFFFAVYNSIHKLQGFGHGCLWEDHYSVYHTLCEKK